MTRSVPPSRSQAQPSLALAAANTVYAVRGQVHDAVDGVAALRVWMGHHVGGDSVSNLTGSGSVSEVQLSDFRLLREALRSLFAMAASGGPGDPGAIAVVNELAGRAPRWPVLTSSDSDYSVAERTSAGPVEAFLAAIASDGAYLLASTQQPPQIRCCAAPGCVQFFLADHSGRRWCSPGCGNRARAARHYGRHGRRPTR